MTTPLLHFLLSYAEHVCYSRLHQRSLLLGDSTIRDFTEAIDLLRGKPACPKPWGRARVEAGGTQPSRAVGARRQLRFPAAPRGVSAQPRLRRCGSAGDALSPAPGTDEQLHGQQENEAALSTLLLFSRDSLPSFSFPNRLMSVDFFFPIY